MKVNPSLVSLVLIGGLGIASAQDTVDASNYPGLFGPAGSSVAVPPPLVGSGGSVSDDLGTYWTARSDGSLGIALITGTGAETLLTGSALQFNISSDPDTLLGALGTGLSLNLGWSATATFNKQGSVLTLKPNSTYRLAFDVNSGSGLLNSVLGVNRQFTVSLLDANSQPVGSVSNGTVVNLLGLQLLTTGTPGTGRAVMDFKTGATVPSGAAKLKFDGSALLPAKLTGIGTTFANISNLSIAYVSPYTLFLENKGVTNPAQQDPNADPDGDGRTNLGEFAFDTNPATGDGSNQHFTIGDPDGGGSETSAGILTFPVRDGADFNPNGGPQLANVDGIHYQVEGSYNLVNWTPAVEEVTPNSSFTSNLPQLQAGWSYRSFRVAGQTSNTPKAFLRVRYY
ncbi:MAG: hypothetical protein QM755_17200 [Luteolibacter sp.]